MKKAEAALEQVKAAQAAQAAALTSVAAEQKEKATAQRRAGRMITAMLAVVGIQVAYVVWSKYETVNREANVMASASQVAIKDRQFERAMRIAVRGLPSPDGVPILSFLTPGWDAPQISRVAAKLAGAANLSPLRRELSGHSAAVLSARISRDGARVVTGSADRTARVWDAARGAELLRLEGHGGPVRSAAFNADGTRIVTACDDRLVRVWDATTGSLLMTLSGHGDGVRSAQFSPDGARIVSASSDKSVRLWDAGQGTEALVLTGHDGVVAGADFSPDGTRVVTSSEDGTARIWDVASGAELVILRGHGSGVASAVFSADGQHVLTSSGDKTMRYGVRWTAHKKMRWKTLMALPSMRNSAGMAVEFSQSGTTKHCAYCRQRRAANWWSSLGTMAKSTARNSVPTNSNGSPLRMIRPRGCGIRIVQ